MRDARAASGDAALLVRGCGEVATEEAESAVGVGDRPGTETAGGVAACSAFADAGPPLESFRALALPDLSPQASSTAASTTGRNE